MPIYEYRCSTCGHEFEMLQKYSDPPADQCKQCGGAEVSKLISQTSFVLKGGGWYKDHYGLKSSNSDASSSDSSSSSSDSSSSSSDSSSSDSSSSSSSSDSSSTSSSDA